MQLERNSAPETARPPFESCDVAARPPASLRNSEAKIWCAVATGDIALCSPSALQDEGDDDLSESEPIRAEFLSWLLTADDLPVTRRVLRVVGATIEGDLDLEAQSIPYPLDFEGCRFSEPIKANQAKLPRLTLDGCDVPALEARQLEITGDLSLTRSRLRWVGLLGAQIGGRLDLTDAQLSNRRANTLNANGAIVGQDVLCRRIRANGQISLVGASIGGNVDLSGASLYPMGVIATKALVGADLKCNERTKVTGSLRFGGISVGGILDLGDATLRGSDGIAVDLEGAKIGSLVLPTRHSPRGIIDLRRTRVGHLDDAWKSTRYQACLNGLVYNTLSERAGDIKARLLWLRAAVPEDGETGVEDDKTDGNSISTYVPQAYEQLATVYRREGCEHNARVVLMEKERERFRSPDHMQRHRRFISKLWGGVFGFFGYGYRWYRGIIVIVGVGILDWRIFTRASTHHEMVVIGPTPHPPPFDPGLYALEAVVPLVDFGQKTLWAPTHLAETFYVASVAISWIALTLTVASITQRYVRQ